MPPKKGKQKPPKPPGTLKVLTTPPDPKKVNNLPKDGKQNSADPTSTSKVIKASPNQKKVIKLPKDGKQKSPKSLPKQKTVKGPAALEIESVPAETKKAKKPFKSVPARGKTSTKMVVGREIHFYNEQELFWLRELCRIIEGAASTKAFQALLDAKHPYMLLLMQGKNNWTKPRTPSALGAYVNAHGHKEAIAAWTPGERLEAKFKMNHLESENKRLLIENEKLKQENRELKEKNKAEVKKSDNLLTKVFKVKHPDFDESNFQVSLKLPRLKPEDLPKEEDKKKTDSGDDLDNSIEDLTKDEIPAADEDAISNQIITEDENSADSSNQDCSEEEVNNVSKNDEPANQIETTESSMMTNVEIDTTTKIDAVPTTEDNIEIVPVTSVQTPSEIEISIVSEQQSSPSSKDEDTKSDDNNNNVSLSKEEISETTDGVQFDGKQSFFNKPMNQDDSGLACQFALSGDDVETTKHQDICEDDCNDDFYLHLSDDSQDNTVQESDVLQDKVTSLSSPTDIEESDVTDNPITPDEEERDEVTSSSLATDAEVSDVTDSMTPVAVETDNASDSDFDSDLDYDYEHEEIEMERDSANEVEGILGVDTPTNDEIEDLIQSLDISVQSLEDSSNTEAMEDVRSCSKSVENRVNTITVVSNPLIDASTLRQIPVLPEDTSHQKEKKRLYHGSGIAGNFKTYEGFLKHKEYETKQNRLKDIDEMQKIRSIEIQNKVDEEMSKNLHRYV